MTKFLSFVVSRAVRKLAPVAVCLAVFAGFSSVPAQAGITYVCAANVDATQAGTCNYLNTVIAGLYSSAFSNANAIIFIQMGTTGLGESTSGFFNEVSYSSYLTALTDEGGTGTVRADAIASRNANATSAYGSDDVEVTSALGKALGL